MRGGKRVGAGRPVGTANKPMFISFWKKREIKEFAEFVKDAYKEDMRVLTWVGDQIFHKAPQSVDLTSGGKPFLIGVADDDA